MIYKYNIIGRMVKLWNLKFFYERELFFDDYIVNKI